MERRERMLRSGEVARMLGVDRVLAYVDVDGPT